MSVKIISEMMYDMLNVNITYYLPTSCMCVDSVARGIDSAAAGSALRAVHAAVLQPAADAAAVISTTTAAAADVRVYSEPAESVADPRRTTAAAAVVSSFPWQHQQHTTGDRCRRVSTQAESSKWTAESRRR